jgi:hypothetical protein
MEQTASNPTKIATKWALINLAAGIIVTYAFQFLNLDQASGWKYISYLPFITFLFLSQKQYKDQVSGYISFGDTFSAGFRYSVFAGLLIAIFIYLYMSVLNPAMFDKALDSSQTAMQGKGLSTEQINKSMEMAKKWGPLFASFGAAIGYAIFGAIISLVGAMIFKREPLPSVIATNAAENISE